MKTLILIFTLLFSFYASADKATEQQKPVELEGLSYFDDVAELCQFEKVTQLKEELAETKDLYSYHKSIGAYAKEYAHKYNYELPNGKKPDLVAQVYILQSYDYDEKLYNPELRPEIFDVYVRDFVNKKSYRAKLVKSHVLKQYIAVEKCGEYKLK